MKCGVFDTSRFVGLKVQYKVKGKDVPVCAMKACRRTHS